jgi:hypothetical protein
MTGTSRDDPYDPDDARKISDEAVDDEVLAQELISPTQQSRTNNGLRTITTISNSRQTNQLLREIFRSRRASLSIPLAFT